MMGLEAGLLGGAILLIILLVIVTGFICYMFRNLCNKKTTDRTNARDSKKREETYESPGDRSYKTTTDDESTMKLQTLDQILKQEERSAFSLQPFKLPSNLNKE